MTSWTPWVVFLVGTLAASLVFLPYCLQNREERGAVPLAVMFVGIILWLVSELLQLQSSAPNALGGVSLRVLGSGVTVIGTVLLGVEYTGREQWLKPAVLGALAVEPAVVLTLALVRPGLLFETVPATVPWGYEIVSPSLLWMGHVVYSFSLALLGLALLAHMMWQSSYAYRLRILALMIATSVPILVNGVYQVGLLPFDLTPASFLFTAFVLMYATFRVEFMQALPVARRTVLEQMEDLVFVLDTEGRVTTVNSAVTDVFGEATQMSGVPVGQVLGEDSLGDVETGEQSREVSVPVAGETRLFDVSKTVVTDYRGDMLAQVLVCRDVTEQRRRKEQIELLKDVQSRFLRHNLRNKMNAILAHAEFMREESGPPPEDSYDTIVETSQQLIEWGEKARMIEHLVESAEQSRREVCADLAAIVDEMGARHSDVTFETDIDDEAWIVTVPQIESAFENLIDNAARYNEGDDPRVSVTTDISDGRVTIAIADNGPGINRDEIETITSGEETQLEHSSGLGLWLVYWVVETSRGDIEFETDDGTTIRLEFERVDPPADPTPDAPRIVED
jgi:PAS domain S-box-containing protein